MFDFVLHVPNSPSLSEAQLHTEDNTLHTLYWQNKHILCIYIYIGESMFEAFSIHVIGMTVFVFFF